MTVINVQSIKDAVRMGTLIELSSDYRTSAFVRTILPKNTPCAISPAAFRRHVQQGTAGERRSGVEALCVFLSSAFGFRGKPSQADSGLQFPREGGKLQGQPLKLEWYAPNEHWVVLLPDEQLRPVLNLV
jgi:hypothetical protein